MSEEIWYSCVIPDDSAKALAEFVFHNEPALTRIPECIIGIHPSVNPYMKAILIVPDIKHKEKERVFVALELRFKDHLPETFIYNPKGYKWTRHESIVEVVNDATTLKFDMGHFARHLLHNQILKGQL